MKPIENQQLKLNSELQLQRESSHQSYWQGRTYHLWELRIILVTDINKQDRETRELTCNTPLDFEFLKGRETVEALVASA